MRLKEQRLWDRFSAALKKAHVAAERIENLVGKGTPDTHGAPHWWCELKATAAPPARATTPLLGKSEGLRRDQINWHLWWAAGGGHSWVLIGVGSHENYLLPGRLAANINRMTYQQVKAAAITGWPNIIKELTK